MITNFFFPEWNNHDVQKLWFQHDGATCHTARASIDLLKDMFGDRLISRFGPVNWPPRSCDLTPIDYFLSLVYADKPETLDHLEDNIRRVIADIRPQMLEKVIENWTSRLDYIQASRGIRSLSKGDQFGPEKEDTRNTEPTLKIQDRSNSPLTRVVRRLREDGQAVRIQKETDEPNNNNNAKKWEKYPLAEGRF
ncbi:DUF4817 domain-containing protein [Trichonephila clavipes]|uniref:DUF4817 domain-containing protein n=1 Tax=Trichonephila clavipes TaxID=2585209 RepID=A0A8X6V9I0_TRICX|nr:DUF4817 domain-containing protein [Trichonephila clavipes]